MKNELWVWDEFDNAIKVQEEHLKEIPNGLMWAYEQLLPNGVVVLHAIDIKGSRTVLETWASSMEQAAVKFASNDAFVNKNPLVGTNA